MKSVLISVKPHYCELICKCIGWDNQRPQYKKRLELRKTAPKPPFKCYIYCTLSGSNEFFKEDCGGNIAEWNRSRMAFKKGKVIGEFICEYVLNHCEMSNADIAEKLSCVSREDILKYANGKNVFGWHIDNLVIYNEPKELSEFYTECQMNCEHCEMWGYTRVNADEFDMDCKSDWFNHKPLKRPPQSWCYVEGIKGK